VGVFLTRIVAIVRGAKGWSYAWTCRLCSRQRAGSPAGSTGAVLDMQRRHSNARRV